ncbi:MAG: universal stress protein [Proteobacteria bacterium]|nr:universal stress protein [Pseudomonadota bacterium]
MSLKTILAPVSGGEGDAAVLAAAEALARRFGAHVVVLHAKGDARDAVPFLGEGASGALIEQIMVAAQRDADGRAERAKAAFTAWRDKAGLTTSSGNGGSVTWREETGAEDEWVSRLGRLSDLMVLPCPGGSGSVASTITLEAALLDTGRPVLAVPMAGFAGRLGDGPIVIAWNGSAQASRAVAGALELLAAAPRVVIVAAREGKSVNPDAAGLADYLSWHGVKAEATTPMVKSTSVGAQVLSDAAALGAGLLVMGAYTHNRLRQMVFGGVTRHVLAHATLPVLLAH